MHARISVLALFILTTCHRGEEPTPVSANASVFQADFPFECADDPKVACSGLFPAHGDTPGPASRAALLNDGLDAFRLRIQTLQKARKSIRIQALIFRGDETGLHIATLLKKKKRQGLDVRVIVDAASNLDLKTQWMYFDLKQHGIEVEGYEALYLNFLSADLKIRDPLRPNKRFHDKMWVVDAEDPKRALAIVGGLNIANEYFRIDAAPANRWRDQDVALRGPIVHNVAAAFDRNYDYFKGLKGRLPAALNPDNSWKLTRAVLGKIRTIRLPNWTDAKLVARIDQSLTTQVSPRFEPVTARFLQARPRFDESYIHQTYLHLIRQAKESIAVANAYFVPCRELIDALKDAARRGVTVELLTNSPETNDIGAVATISRALYAELLAVNREMPAAHPRLSIYEWAGARFAEGTLHAKFAVFDANIALVGSHNLDPRSERLNSETGVVIRHSALATRLLNHFRSQDLRKSVAIDWQQAQRFRRPDGLREKFKLLFALPIKEWL